jgi:SAM-dependent methyltransferase
VALPLSSRVVGYTGVDASPEMLDRLRSKVGAERIDIVEGDMAEVPVAGTRFGVVFFSYNTFFNITSVEAQADCLRRAAAVLVDGGHLVIEAFVPDDDPPAAEGVIVPTHMTLDTVVLTATMRDPATQTIAGQHIELLDGRPHLHPWFIRYTRPHELDAMATAAGLTLVDRDEGWRGEPFDEHASSHHVSVYRRAT